MSTIFNLGETQRAKQQIINFKNHEYKLGIVRPKYAKEEYRGGDEMQFSLKGLGVDYLNFNNSRLRCEITYTIKGTGTVDTTLYILSSFWLINRLKFEYGTEVLCDISNYGRTLFNHWMGTSKVSNPLVEYKLNVKANPVLTLDPFTGDDTKASKTTHVTIPLLTLFDEAGYVPMYKLADELIMTIKLPPAKNIMKGY